MQIDLSRFEDYPYFLDSFMQYEGVVMPALVDVTWQPIKPYLHTFDDDTEENPEFIEDVSNMIKRGEDVPPLLVLDGKLFDGRHRAWAAKDAGLKRAPVVDITPYWGRA
jgi:hypothetical protein